MWFESKPLTNSRINHCVHTHTHNHRHEQINKHVWFSGFNLWMTRIRCRIFHFKIKWSLKLHTFCLFTKHETPFFWFFVFVFYFFKFFVNEKILQNFFYSHFISFQMIVKPRISFDELTLQINNSKKYIIWCDLRIISHAFLELCGTEQ